MSDPIILLVAVGLISILCQFVAYKVKLPAILPLLLAGILVGPVTGIIDPDVLFGDLLFPIVSLSVAIILFEGALTLKLEDLSGHGSMVRNLCTYGAIITWLIVSPIAHFGLGMSWQMAFLLGAILTVTGPTVIVPMLRTVRPSSKVANILRWEGIIIDPVGALLAVLVFEYIISTQNALSHTLTAFTLTIAVGIGFGVVFGYLLGILIRHHLIPHYLVNTAALTLMLGAFAGSNFIAHESGLLTVTIMGMWLTNMKKVDVEGIVEFKETLSVLLISGLFILLASRIEPSAILSLGWGAILVLFGILFIARPVSVILSSLGTKLTWQEIALLSWISPRGIVAAAVSALFALKLEALNYAQVELLVPMVFLVIISSVVLQSLTSVKIAQYLGLRAPAPHGFLLFGGGEFARAYARELMKQNVTVCLADTNWETISNARMEGIPTYFGNPISDHASRTLDLSQFGSVLVLSPYKQLNPLVTYHFEHQMGKGAVYGLNNRHNPTLSSHQVSESYAEKLGLFSEDVNYGKLASFMAKGAIIKTTRISEEFTFENYEQEYDGKLLTLCAIDSKGKVHMYTHSNSIKAKADWRIISLIQVI
ncbi:cation:proton antiporter [Paraglaciecola sp.]|uniref:cation:proton antiporter n=1 Tax=Paraglaciecola sp. TaxID=1920173 RepID=UPI003EF98577